MAEESFDIVFVGGGPAGYVGAIRAAQLGLKTACVEQEKLLGGTCLRVGCIPSKALIQASELYTFVTGDAKGMGIMANGVELDVSRLQQWKDRVVKTLASGVDFLFKKYGVVPFHSTAKILEPGKVSLADGRLLPCKYVVLASGSVPMEIPGVRFGGRVVSSSEALSLPRVPKSMVVIGAGFIGLELGSVYARLGTRVSVVEVLDRILPNADEEVARTALRLLRRQGLDFKLGARVLAVEQDDDKARVILEDAEPLDADLVLLAVGRKPSFSTAVPDELGLATDERGFVRVDTAFKTSVDGIFAVGDVIGGPMLAHKAHHEAVACVERLLGKGAAEVDYDLVPKVAYLDPEVAWVGKTEEELSKQGIRYRKGVFPFRASGRAHTLHRMEGFAKVLADEKTDRLLGVHIIGPQASELVAEATAAMAFGASAEDLSMVSHAHPTLAEALREAALGAFDVPVHV